LPTKLFWANVEYFGMVTAPVAWLAFVLQYVDRGEWLTRRRWMLLGIIPLATVLLVWTNPAHGLMRHNATLGTVGSFSVITKTYGPWFWVHIAYSYLVIALGVWMLLRSFFKSGPLYRQQVFVLLISALMPWLGNALFVCRVSPLDLAPVAFTVTGMAVAWGLL